MQRVRRAEDDRFDIGIPQRLVEVRQHGELHGGGRDIDPRDQVESRVIPYQRRNGAAPPAEAYERNANCLHESIP